MFRTVIAICLIFASAVTTFAASPIEGDWQVNDGGARLRFVPSAGRTDAYDILWLDGPDFSIPASTLIGNAVVTPTPGVYDCTIVTDPRGRGDRKRHTRFVVKIDAATGDSFTFAPYDQGVKVDYRVVLPYWLRRSVKSVDTRPGGLDGARRVGAPNQYVEL